MVTTLLHPDVEEDEIYMTPPESSPKGLKAPALGVQLKKALHSLKQVP